MIRRKGAALLPLLSRLAAVAPQSSRDYAAAGSARSQWKALAAVGHAVNPCNSRQGPSRIVRIVQHCFLQTLPCCLALTGCFGVLALLLCFGLGHALCPLVQHLSSPTQACTRVSFLHGVAPFFHGHLLVHIR